MKRGRRLGSTTASKEESLWQTEGGRAARKKSGSTHGNSASSTTASRTSPH